VAIDNFIIFSYEASIGDDGWFYDFENGQLPATFNVPNANTFMVGTYNNLSSQGFHIPLPTTGIYCLADNDDRVDTSKPNDPVILPTTGTGDADVTIFSFDFYLPGTYGDYATVEYFDDGAYTVFDILHPTPIGWESYYLVISNDPYQFQIVYHDNGVFAQGIALDNIRVTRYTELSPGPITSGQASITSGQSAITSGTPISTATGIHQTTSVVPLTTGIQAAITSGSQPISTTGTQQTTSVIVTPLTSGPQIQPTPTTQRVATPTTGVIATTGQRDLTTGEDVSTESNSNQILNSVALLFFSVAIALFAL